MHSKLYQMCIPMIPCTLFARAIRLEGKYYKTNTTFLRFNSTRLETWPCHLSHQWCSRWDPNLLIFGPHSFVSTLNKLNVFLSLKNETNWQLFKFFILNKFMTTDPISVLDFFNALILLCPLIKSDIDRTKSFYRTGPF